MDNSKPTPDEETNPSPLDPDSSLSANHLQISEYKLVINYTKKIYLIENYLFLKEFYHRLTFV